MTKEEKLCRMLEAKYGMGAKNMRKAIRAGKMELTDEVRHWLRLEGVRV